MSESSRQIDPLTARVAEYIDAGRLIPARAGILVGVSGGPDSVALLAVLRELAGRQGRQWALTVGHLNHALRAEAGADATFVAELAEKWSLPCVVEARDVAAEAAKAGGGIEQAARRLRYDFLGLAADRCGASIVAVGHHADDNVETVLYRIARGTHLRGLAGMPASRRLAGAKATLVRPLLGCRRKDIEAFCRRAGLKWRTDQTNLQVRYRRNLIRHELLPLMRDKLNLRVDQAVERLAAAAGEAEQYLLGQAAGVLEKAELQAGPGALAVDRDILSRQPAVIRRYVMRLAMEKLALPLGHMPTERFEQLSALADPDGPSAVALSGRYIAKRQEDRIVISPADQDPRVEDWVVNLECPGRTSLPDGRKITCRIGSFAPADFRAHCREHPPGVEMLDADRLRGRLVCRPRRDGDAFRPLGCPGRQSVSDFLTNLKLPRPQRDVVRCICDEVAIVYLVPLRIDERAKVTAQTKRVLRIVASGIPGR